MTPTPPTAPCPVCETPTVGIHLAGAVFDFTCQRCADETDANFRDFVADVIAEIDGGAP